MSKTIKNCQKPEILKSFKKEFHFQNQHHKTLGNTINIDKKKGSSKSKNFKVLVMVQRFFLDISGSLWNPSRYFGYEDF